MSTPTDEFPEVWTTLDGRKLKVSEMDENNVRATLNMLLRRSRQRLALQRMRIDIEPYLSMPQHLRDLMAKHDIDDWPELNTSDASTKGASW